jgi:hypothetical protein
MAAATLHYLAVNAEDAVTIASAGAIPLLVQLLKPGTRDDVQHNAAGALSRIAANSENAVTITIVTAGAIPLLAQLLRSGADNDTKAAASLALEAIRRGVAANRAAVAAAKASADVAHAMERLGVDSSSDALSS